MKPKSTLWLAIIPGKPGIQILFRKPKRAWFAVEVEVRRGKLRKDDHAMDAGILPIIR